MEEVPMDDEMLMDLTGAVAEDTAQAAQLDAQVQEHSTASTNKDAMKLLTELNDTEDIADTYHQDPSYDNMAELLGYIENLYSMAVGLDQFKLAHHREIDQQREMIGNLIKHFSETDFAKGKHALEDLIQKCLDKVSRYSNLVADQLQTGEVGKIKPSPDKQKRPTAQLGTRVVEDVSRIDDNVLTENIRKHLRDYLFTHAERQPGYFLQQARKGPSVFGKWIFNQVLVDWVLGDQLRYPEGVLHNVKQTRVIGVDDILSLLNKINYSPKFKFDDREEAFAKRTLQVIWGLFPKEKRGVAAMPTPQATKADRRLNLVEEPVGPPIPTPAKPRMIKSFPTPDPDKDDVKEEPTPEYPELVELLRKADDGFTTSELLKDSGYSSNNKLRGHLEKLRKAGWLQREKKPRGKNNRDVWVYYVNADKFVDDTASSYYPAREREYAPDPSKGFVRDEPEKGQEVLDLEPAQVKGMMRKDGREVIDLPEEKASEVSQIEPVIKPEPASSPVIAAAPAPAVPAPVKQNILFPAEDDESEAPEVRVLGGGDRSRSKSEARRRSPPPPPPRKKSPPPPPPPAPKEKSILGRMLDFAGDVRSRIASTIGFANTEDDGVSHHSQSRSVDDSTDQFEDGEEDEKSPLTQRREEAIKKFVDNYKGPRVGGTEIQKLFESNEWKKYYEYNDHLNRIQPVLNYGYNRLEEKKHYRFSRRGRSTQPRFQEQVRLQYHPETHLRKRALQASKQYDDFRRVHERSQQTQVGEYISLNILPAMLYITIRKGVQIAALKILCERLAVHCQGQPTRILLKHSPKSGKFTYTPWLSSKVLESLDAHGLFVRFINRSKDRTKTLQIIVRQNIANGKIQELWENRKTLL